MRILLGSAGCDCIVVSNAQQALATIEQKDFDAVVLDPQSSSSLAEEVTSRISEIHPNLLARIVVITDKDSDPETRDLVERYSLFHVQRQFLDLKSLLRPEAVSQQVTHVAQLIFDSSRDPLQAGVRSSLVRSRRLLCASGSLRVDLWIEPQADSDRMAVMGQILDAAKPDRRFDSVPVVLQGWKGAVACATTNEFGEFHLDFKFEPSVTLEVKIHQNYLLTVSLPGLEGATQRKAYP
jgi:hypothetical protein